MIYFFSLCLQ